MTVTDTDFFDCAADQVLSIKAVLVDLPPRLEDFERYGAFVCGVAQDGSIVSDPADGCARGMTFRFMCDESLEPVWEVVKPGDGLEPRRLSVATRRELPFFRVDDRSDQHLRWSRGSHLERLTGDTTDAKTALVAAHRRARQAVFDADLDALETTSRAVALGVTAIGGDAVSNPGVGLDPTVLASGASLVLHNGNLPFTTYGLGMRRLSSLAVQRLERSGASVVAMDEIEHGLEPHRLIRLLQVLREEGQQGTQVLLTTHSPVAVEALDAEMLAVVRSTNGVTTITSVPSELAGLADEPQGTIRSGPSAILARRVLVVEGATEEGLLRTLVEGWDTAERNLAMAGVVVRNGHNDEQALRRAECLARLGFDVGALIDHDNRLDDQVARAEAAGAHVFRWGEGHCLESQLAHDLPEDLFESLLNLAADTKYDDPSVGPRAVLDAIGSKMEITIPSTEPPPWNRDVSTVRSAIGRVAADRDWFKSNAGGAALGEWLLNHFNRLVTEDDADRRQLVTTLQAVRAFLYEQLPAPPPSDADG